MPQNNRYEQQFLEALKDIFIGARVEGDSGYINLMKIKARYFESGVFPQLMVDINAACKPFELSFREELFDKLYDFFKRSSKIPPPARCASSRMASTRCA